MGLEPLVARAFDLLTGAPIMRVPASNMTWSQAVNDPGSADVTVAPNEGVAHRGLRDRLRPWKTAIALMRGDRVIHAGPLVARNVSRSTGDVHLNVGGGWTILDKRLVLNYALKSMWKNGEVLLDEENPAPHWQLTLTGSLVDVARGLIAETMKWGELPIDLPPAEGGVNSRRYDCWDFAKVSERIKQLCEVQGGPEIRFDPRVTATGNLRWLLRGADELTDNDWHWNTSLPGVRAMMEDIDEDGDAMASMCFALGGRKDDVVLTALAQTPKLTAAGWPLLQVADTSHSTVSELATLLGHAGETVARGSITQESFKLRIGVEYAVAPGDHANVIIEDPYFGRARLPLKILAVSGDSGDWMSVEARLRNEEAKWQATTRQQMMH